MHSHAPPAKTCGLPTLQINLPLKKLRGRKCMMLDLNKRIQSSAKHWLGLLPGANLCLRRLDMERFRGHDTFTQSALADILAAPARPDLAPRHQPFLHQEEAGADGYLGKIEFSKDDGSTVASRSESIKAFWRTTSGLLGFSPVFGQSDTGKP